MDVQVKPNMDAHLRQSPVSASQGYCSHNTFKHLLKFQFTRVILLLTGLTLDAPFDL
jgi:hypothetical protein